MDASPLVIDEIQTGAEFIKRIQAHMPVKAAYWLRRDEDEGRYLYIALEGLTTENLGAAYDEVWRVSREMKDHYINPLDVKLVPTDDRVAHEVQDFYRRFPGRVPPHRFDERSVGGTPIVEMYIYPPPDERT
jgi:hypothetical protein